MVLRGSCSPFDDLLSHGPFLEAFQSTAAGDLSDLFAEPDNTAQMRADDSSIAFCSLSAHSPRRGPLLIAIDDLPMGE